MKNRKIQSGTMVVGFITAIAIVLSQFFYFQSPLTTVEVKTEQHQAGDEQETGSETHLSISTAPTSLPSSFHVAANHSSVFLFEILYGEETSAKIQTDILPSFNTFFQTLLRIIISPNAP